MKANAATLCAILIGAFYLATVRDGHDWADDFSMYIRHAQNIAHGAPYAETGYIYNPLNPDIGPRAYPPGFPIVLAPVVRLFGLDLRPMKTVVVGFFIGTLLVIVPLFRSALSPTYLVGLVLVVGLLPLFWELKDHILSDIPFLFFILASLYLFMKADDPSVPRHRRAALAVLSGIAAYASFATRILGLVLVPSFVAHDLIRRKNIGMPTALASLVVVSLAGVQYAFWISDASYLDQFTSPLTAARRNVPSYLQSLSELWENGYSGAIRKIAFLISVALAAAGYVVSLRTNAGLFHAFPCFYLMPVILWPSFQGFRFLIPIVPFFFYFCLLAIQRADLACERRWRLRNVVLTVFLALVLSSYAARYSTLRFAALAEGITKQESVELFEFTRARTDPNDVLVFSRPRALALFTGRRVSGVYDPADPCGLWQYIGEIRASYLVTGPERDPFNDDAVYLRRFVSQFRHNVREIMANRDLAIYRIEQIPPCGLQDRTGR